MGKQFSANDPDCICCTVYYAACKRLAEILTALAVYGGHDGGLIGPCPKDMLSDPIAAAPDVLDATTAKATAQEKPPSRDPKDDIDMLLADIECVSNNGAPRKNMCVCLVGHKKPSMAEDYYMCTMGTDGYKRNCKYIDADEFWEKMDLRKPVCSACINGECICSEARRDAVKYRKMEG